MTPVQMHWIPENRASRTPRTHIVLDSEAVITAVRGEQVHTFRCAVTSCDRVSSDGSKWAAPVWGRHESTVQVWEWVTSMARPRERTVVVAHNLGYDLRVTNGFAELAELGWELEGLSLNPGATWVSLKRQGATLLLVDSMTWIPAPLEAIGRRIGIGKLELPEQTDPHVMWLERCELDVGILREAWLRLVTWLRKGGHGNWRPTGAGQSWSDWRHNHLTHRILSHGDDELRALERRASWTGRAEAWRHGRQSGGPWVEWDWSLAYARVARDIDVPVRLLGVVAPAPAEIVFAPAEKLCVLAEVVVETDVPTVPANHGDRIVWPVGRFETVLWDCEARLALEHGAKVTVKRAWAYRSAPALRQWAEWAMAIAENTNGEHDPVIALAVKHWCRALIGRFGSRFSSWEYFGESNATEPRLGVIRIDGESENRRLFQVGEQCLISTGETDARQSAPQVMSLVMAEARVRLWRAMTVAGLENVVYVDTDSIIVNEVGSHAIKQGGFEGFRIKAKLSRLDIHGPRALVVDGSVRASGVPRGARRVGRRRWEGEAWSSLSGSLGASGAGEVRVARRAITLGDRTVRRSFGPGGVTMPIRLPMADS